MECLTVKLICLRSEMFDKITNGIFDIIDDNIRR